MGGDLRREYADSCARGMPAGAEIRHPPPPLSSGAMDTTKDRTTYLHASEYTPRQKHTLTKLQQQQREAEKALRRAQKSQQRLKAVAAKMARDAKAREVLAAEGVEENPGPGKQPKRLCRLCKSPDHLQKNCPTKATPAGVDPDGIDVTRKPAEVVEQVQEQAFSSKVEALLTCLEHSVPRETARKLVRGGYYEGAMEFFADREVTDDLVADYLGDCGICAPVDKPVEPKRPDRSLKGLRFTTDEFRELLEGEPASLMGKFDWLTAPHRWGKRLANRCHLNKRRLVCVAISYVAWIVAVLALTSPICFLGGQAGFWGGHNQLAGCVEGRCPLACSSERVLSMILTQLALVSVVHAIAACHVASMGWICASVKEYDVSHSRDVRIRTNTHVPLIPNALRCHRYKYYAEGEAVRLYVCDHWATVALSEYGGGPIDQFLSNVHTKFLRCAGLNVSDKDYEALKQGTTKFLKIYLEATKREDFQVPLVLSWEGGRRI